MPANFVTWRKSDLLQQFITTKRAYFADLYAHLGDLVQPLFDLGHEPDSDDDRDDVALIAHQRDGIQPAEHRLVGLHALGRNGPGVLQVGVDHDHADDHAQERVAAEDFRGGEGNEDGHMLENSWSSSRRAALSPAVR